MVTNKDGLAGINPAFSSAVIYKMRVGGAYKNTKGKEAIVSYDDVLLLGSAQRQSVVDVAIRSDKDCLLYTSDAADEL